MKEICSFFGFAPILGTQTISNQILKHGKPHHLVRPHRLVAGLNSVSNYLQPKPHNSEKSKKMRLSVRSSFGLIPFPAIFISPAIIR